MIVSRRIFALLLPAALLSACTKSYMTPENLHQEPVSINRTLRIANAPVLGAPVSESKIYKLIPGVDHSTDFEASGVQYLGGYLYVVNDNMQKMCKIKLPLAENDPQNLLLSTGTPGSGASGFEGISFDTHANSNFYVVEEAAKNGSVYQPRIYEYDASMAYQSRMWAEYNFTSANANKGFEGIAWVYRGGENYLLGLVEGTGKVVVLKKTSSKWAYVTEITLPSTVTFSDYSDLALSAGGKIAITSQEDGQLWIGTLSPTSWTITGGAAYSFPTGDASGNIGAGGLQLYGNVEGVSFITESQVAICSDRTKSDQPSYQQYKEMTVSIFNLP